MLLGLNQIETLEFIFRKNTFRGHFYFCNSLLVQTNNGGRGQSIAVAVKLRVFQVAGLSKFGSPSQNEKPENQKLQNRSYFEKFVEREFIPY